MLTLLRQLGTGFALDSMGSYPPKEMVGGTKDEKNKFVSTLEVKNKR